MDVTRILEADHRQVEDLMSQIEKADSDERAPLIEQMRASLTGHMTLEENVLYPAMGGVTGQETVEEAGTEHDLVRKSLDDVERLGPDEPGFGAALEALRAAVRHHVEDEEGEVFPELRREGASVLEQVATPFVHQRLELGLPMEADALAAASSKEELVHEAKGAGIDGATSMTKDDLASALAAKMTV